MIDLESLGSLELDRVVDHLRELTATRLGDARAAGVRPLATAAEAACEAKKTSEMARLLVAGRDVALGETGDVRPVLDTLEKDGMCLTGDEIACVLRLVVTTALVVRFLAALEDAPALRALLRALPALRELETALRRTVDDEGHVLDSASPELGSIRAQRRTVRERLDRAVERWFEAHPALGERIATVRDDRTVVAVRSDLNPTKLGIVHGRSTSGATLYVEPFELVEANNRATELRDEEASEVERVLRAITHRLAAAREELAQAADLVGEIDLVRARARMHRRFDAGDVEASPDGGIHLEDARHPLLVLAGVEREVVPLSLTLAAGETIVITGPNTGGKTVALKTVGLALLLYACGLPVPARRSRLPLVRSLHADIGDPQDIAQSLSTFSGHVRNVARALRALEPPAVVLLDELGAGTDPREGAALGVAVVEALRKAGATSIVTSHHEPLKRYALGTPGVRSAAVEFDEQTLRPTYRLLLDRTGRSNALVIAERTGMPGEVVEHARRLLAGEATDTERLLARLEEEARAHDAARARAVAEREVAARERAELHDRERQIATREADLRMREKGVRARVRAQTEARLGEVTAALRKEGEALLAEAVTSGQRRKVEEKLAGKLAAAKSAVEREVAAEDVEAEVVEVAAGLPRVGDRVRVRRFGVVGRLQALDGAAAAVAVAGKTLRVAASDLERVSAEAAPAPVPRREAEHGVMPRDGMRPEINVIGLRVDDAIPQVEKFLDDAILAHLPEVRIIHGMGTGRLRASVHEHLKAHAHVRSFESESAGGATRALLEV